MVFFKRLSRGSGSRSNSYADDDFDRPRSQGDDLTRFTKTDDLVDSPRQSSSQHNSFPRGTTEVPAKETQHDMYPRSSVPQEPYSMRSNGIANTGSSRQNSAAFEAKPAALKLDQAPDLLTRAFNEAVRPYQDKIEQLEAQVTDLQAWADQLEAQRSEMYSWIDKRGLRTGKRRDPKTREMLTTGIQMFRLQSQKPWTPSQMQPLRSMLS
jgi:hypothetical protein